LSKVKNPPHHPISNTKERKNSINKSLLVFRVLRCKKKNC
jgi:hypothetical protein